MDLFYHIFNMLKLQIYIATQKKQTVYLLGGGAGGDDQSPDDSC